VTRPVPEACLGLLHTFEQGPHGGFAAWPYRDPAGNPTDGWGHLIVPHDPPKTYPLTEAQADTQAVADLLAAGADLLIELGAGATSSLTEGQYGALIDFVFNEGIGHFITSSMCRLIHLGVLSAVADEFPKWVYGRINGVETVLPGLVTRRAAERDLWLS
jgi:lysozyme